ncbi:MAG: 50S ribosomal protein L21 [Geodermatophilaceae bacterium]|nr:50S ribosomal protein L21 [Geodermatophilaceae bacterium]
MYAVVKAGGKQHKVAVGDVVEVNRLEGIAGDAVSLPALLLVDGRTVVSETSALAKIAVTGEIVGHHKGPKIKILKYKNKTGYRRRIGHRQLLTELLVTDIDDGKPKKKAKASTADAGEKPVKAAKPAAKAEPKKAASTKAESTKAESTKASAKSDVDEKPTKTAPAKAAVKDDDEKPPKAAKATKTSTAPKASKATKTAETAATSSKASATDEKED